MEFIRQNAFYVVLVVIVLALAVGSWFINDSFSDSYDASLNKRLQLSETLQRDANGEMVNKEILAANRGYLNNQLLGARKVVDQCVKWNSKNFLDQILSAKLDDGKTVAAFPIIDPNRFDTLGYKFSQNYLDRVDAVIHLLTPIVPLTEEELTRASKEAEKEEKERQANPGSTKSSVTDRARDNARAKRASEGMLYLDPDFTDKVFAKAVQTPGRKELWLAQVHLWVLGDLVDVIAAANEQAVRGEGAQILPRNVVNSAVKRIMKIEINRDYFLPKSVTVSPSGASTAGLTKRACTKDYDVIRYKMILVMPYRYVPLLERKLLEHNLHTVLNLNVNPEGPPDMAKYYIGPDPAVLVTLEGELLLLTAWERGSIGENKKWTLPPLMPAEMLKDLKEGGAPMRSEDEQVISGRWTK